MAYIIGLRSPDGKRVRRGANLNDNDYVVTPSDNLEELSAKYGEPVQVGDVIPVSERDFKVGELITDRIKPEQVNFDLMRELDPTLTDERILESVKDMDVDDYGPFEEGVFIEALGKLEKPLLKAIKEGKLSDQEMQQLFMETKKKSSDFVSKYKPTLQKVEDRMMGVVQDAVKTGSKMYEYQEADDELPGMFPSTSQYEMYNLGKEGKPYIDKRNFIQKLFNSKDYLRDAYDRGVRKRENLLQNKGKERNWQDPELMKDFGA